MENLSYYCVTCLKTRYQSTILQTVDCLVVSFQTIPHTVCGAYHAISSESVENVRVVRETALHPPFLSVTYRQVACLQVALQPCP